MRIRSTFSAFLIAGFLLVGCDDTSEYDKEQISEDVREAIRDAEEAVRDATDELEEKVERSRVRVREARDRMRERSERAREEGDDLDHAIESAIKSIGEVMESIGEALQNDSDVEPVDYQKLRDLLPEEINGMEIVNTDGSRKSGLGIRLSSIEAEYEGPRREMSITILDLGSLKGAAVTSLDYFDGNIEREFDDGYERTTEFDGYPAHVKVDRTGRYHSYMATVMVADRFVVTIEADGRGLDEDILENVLNKISLRRLARLAN